MEIERCMYRVHTEIRVVFVRTRGTGRERDIEGLKDNFFSGKKKNTMLQKCH